MGKSSPRPPAAPDPAKTAAAQGAANVEAAIASGLLGNISQVGPGGEVRFTETGTRRVGGQDVPLFEQRTTLDPTGQETFDRQQQLANVLTQAAQQQAGFLPQDRFTLEGLPFAPGDQDFGQQRGDVEQAQFQRSLNLLNPQFEEQERALQENITQRGLPQSGEAATRELERFGRGRSQALEQAALASVLAGGQEQSRLFGLQQATRGQALGERQLERAQPFNELAAFLQGSPALAAPQAFAPVSAGVAPADVLGAQALSNQIAQQNFQTQQQGQQAGLSSGLGLLGTLGSAALLSDKRLKHDVKLLGKFGDHNWYSYKYLWSNVIEFGVMAQEVLKINPSAVTNVNGYYAVKYGDL